MSKHVSLLVAGLLVACMALPAGADPNPDYGYQVKFRQAPMIATPIGDVTGQTRVYYGHNELSTLGQAQQTAPFQGIAMADDFADKRVFADGRPQPVVHLKWWGSYINWSEQPERVPLFLVAWESDVPDPDPDDPATFSHPGEFLQGEVLQRAPAGAAYPGPGSFTEALVPGSNPSEPAYEYNAELACPFPEEPDTVYWLKIAALVPYHEPGTIVAPQWGWHNRDYTVPNAGASTAPAVAPGEHVDGVLPDGQTIWHFQDDAVSAATDLLLNLNATDPCGVVETVLQTDYRPHNYLDDLDGPGPTAGTDWEGIGEHSKDLAFELYTVPEPATLSLLGLGALAVLRRRRTD